MESASLKATEAECAKGRTAPRVKLSDIEASIDGVFFNIGSHAAIPAGEYRVDSVEARCAGPLSTLTICFVVMKNGFTIIGKAAPASPANFDAELGKKLAYEDAVRQIWPLMGFALRDRLWMDKEDTAKFEATTS